MTEVGVKLLVDRFAVVDTTRVVDLATGDPIVLTIASAGGSPGQRQWALRCDTLLKLRHRSMAQLVDYGAIGETQRFEAWRCGPVWTGSHGVADAAVVRVTTFLRRCGLTAGATHATNVRQSVDGPIVMLDASAGYPVDAQSTAIPPAAESLEDCGIVVQPRQIMPAVAELFAVDGDIRPQIAALWGNRGAGKSTVLSELARFARVRGFVPVAVHVVAQREFRALLAGRSLFLIADDTPVGWRALLSATLNTPKPHVMVCAGAEEVSGIYGMALDRLAPSRLVGSVYPPILTAAAAGRVHVAAANRTGKTCVRRAHAAAGDWRPRTARRLAPRRRGSARPGIVSSQARSSAGCSGGDRRSQRSLASSGKRAASC